MKHLAFLLLVLPLCLAAKPKEKKFLEIKSRQIEVIQDLTRGGAIAYISKQGSYRNLVNIFDEGRYIQQSYYAGHVVNRIADGQSTFWTPWSWNPIQVGDFARNRARILETRTTRRSTYVRCTPMLWDMDNHPAEAEMEQWTEVKGNVIHVRNRLTCHRTDNVYGEGIENDQEIPAVYPISALNHLYFYQGKAPFTGERADTAYVEELRFTEPQNGWGYYTDVPEKWMAFVDDEGWGMGVYTPSATAFKAGRYKPSRRGEALSEETSYIAPLCRRALMKNDVFEYDYYIIIGTVQEIQDAVYLIKNVER